MGYIFLQKICFISFVFLITGYYISAFRLIHIAQQSQDKTIKSNIFSDITLKEKYLNQTLKLLNRNKVSENEERPKTKIISERKLKSVQPIIKEEIMRPKKTTSEKTNEKQNVKPITTQKEPEKKEGIEVEDPPKKETVKVVKKQEKSESVKLKDEKIETKSKQKPVQEIKQAENVKLKDEKIETNAKQMPVKEIKQTENIKLKDEKIETKLKQKPVKETKRTEKVKLKDETIETKSKQKPVKQIKQTKDVPKKVPETKKVAVKENNEANQIRSIFNSSISSLYFNLPSFSPNFDILKDEECKSQGKILIDQLKKHKLWALKMLDSTAKIPSGILKGNLNQLGDYDQCLGLFTKIPSEASDIKIFGKYCLANIDIIAELQDMKLPVHLAQSRTFIRSKFRDPGHFIPRFTTIRWGLCIPSACTAQDAEDILKDALKTYNDSSIIGVNFDISVEDDNCHVRKLPKKLLDYHYTTIITVTLTATIILLVFIATIRDINLFKKENEEGLEETTASKLLMCFSLKRTLTSLLRVKSDADEIKCIHGIRTICTFIVYIAHKLIPMGHLPFTNRTTLTEMANNPLSIILRVSVIYTDSFLLLSGILTSYGMSKDIEEKGHIPWFNRIVARFVRLTPSLLIVLLYYAYVMELFGDGPLWNTIITSNANLCKEHWWRNLLYIQNIYPFQDMCATHTHQLALDMQLSLIAPILVWLLYRMPLMGVCTTILLHAISVIVRYYSTLNYRLSLVIYHGISVTQLYRTANMLYSSSVHRATPYLAGVGLGVLLRQIKPNFYMPKMLSVLGWIISGYFAVWTFYTPSHLSNRMYQYDVDEAAQFSALCTLAWTLTLSWLIFFCFADNEGYINSFLSSRAMIILSKISYAFYLTQFFVLFYNVGTTRSAAEFKLSSSIDLCEITVIIVISTILTLFIDMPAQKIKNILFKENQMSKDLEIFSDNTDIVGNNFHKLFPDSQKSKED